jgi:hypothetical protein
MNEYTSFAVPMLVSIDGGSRVPSVSEVSRSVDNSLCLEKVSFKAVKFKVSTVVLCTLKPTSRPF